MDASGVERIKAGSALRSLLTLSDLSYPVPSAQSATLSLIALLNELPSRAFGQGQRYTSLPPSLGR